MPVVSKTSGMGPEKRFLDRELQQQHQKKNPIRKAAQCNARRYKTVQDVGRHGLTSRGGDLGVGRKEIGLRVSGSHIWVAAVSREMDDGMPPPNLLP